jgi:hypothetical protein
VKTHQGFIVLLQLLWARVHCSWLSLRSQDEARPGTPPPPPPLVRACEGSVGESTGKDCAKGDCEAQRPANQPELFANHGAYKPSIF